MAEKEEKKEEKDTKEERKIQYRFGKKKLNLFKPSKGYPSKDEAKKKPSASLKLSHSFGYSGAPVGSRQNLYISNDNKYLIYYIAAVVIVLNIETKEQRFFTLHNDDITALAIDTREGSTKVASGQTDPIDRPGEGKDLPKVYVWDLETLKSIELIDKICWGFISKICWSSKTGYIYVLCGDDDQTLKVFDEKTFKKKKDNKDKKGGKKKGKKPSKAVKDVKNKKAECSHKPILEMTTMKESIYGFIHNKNPANNIIDELIFFGKRKYSYIALAQDKNKKGIEGKLKSVSITKLVKEGEKSFNSACYLKNGYYAVGSSSGNVYINKGSEAICVVLQAHSKPIGAILYDGTHVYTGGNDGKLRKFELEDDIDKYKGKKSKKEPMKRIDSNDIEVQGSDMKFLPKAMVKASNNSIFVGTKTNQIVEIEEKGDTKIIVDGHDGQVWGLCTHPEKELFFTGGYDNCVKLWDAKTLTNKQTYEFPNPDKKKGKTGKEVVTAGWSNDGTCIIVGTEDSNLGVFAFNNEEEKFTFSRLVKIPKKSKNAEEENVSYIRFSPDSKHVAVAHMDSNVYIFTLKVDESDKNFIALEGWKPFSTGAAPTHVQWTKDCKMLKVLTRDYEIGHFNLNHDKKTAKREVNVPDPDKVEWSDDPLVAGWDVQGLYQPGFDGTDLNDCTVTSDGKLIISGDDFGVIRLHNYPAINPSACKEYRGHAEFVVGVELLRNDKKLISCGGADMAIFVWDVIQSNDDESKTDE